MDEKEKFLRNLANDLDDINKSLVESKTNIEKLNELNNSLNLGSSTNELFKKVFTDLEDSLLNVHARELESFSKRVLKKID